MLIKNPKYWVLASITVVFFGFSLYWFNSSVFIYDWGLKANKYVALNVDQNWGVRKKILQISEYILQFAPRPPTIPYERTDKEVGSIPSSIRLLNIADKTSQINRVSNVSQLLEQFNTAAPGDIIVIEPGDYRLIRKRFTLKNSGTDTQKITLMAESFGTVSLHFDSLEGLYLAQSNWSIHNLIFEGVCKNDSYCEHAIHLTGDADNIEISHNRFINFNAHIKSNGRKGRFPDNITVSHNDFYNQRPRNTTNPVTPIDVVGGNNWLIVNNFIADFALKKRDKFTVSYGAFLKGAGQRGKIMGNVVNCAWNVPHQSFLDIRIGLSLGGGGTGNTFCQDIGCGYEHMNGTIENNLILNCKNDVSIYLNKALGSKINNNILLNSLGIDVRFSATTATIKNNQYQGRILARNGAKLREVNNKQLGLKNIPTDFSTEN